MRTVRKDLGVSQQGGVWLGARRQALPGHARFRPMTARGRLER